jgi:hypothetical protein
MPRGLGVHISISRLTVKDLREKVASHLHLHPDARNVMLIYETATADALELARKNNWRNARNEPLRFIIREHGK